MATKLKSVVLTVGLAAGIALLGGTPAMAETAPGCARVTQIGATKQVKDNHGNTVMSIKQFLGCNKNYGYTWVWESWASTHRGFTAGAGLYVEGVLKGYNVDRANDREVWSDGLATVDKCTRGYGAAGVGGDVTWAGETEQRC
ncbi:hypothetical protein ABZ345_09610 [Lentzea sp. NPDC005914]|uniref:hypothetical protein n=1 Tax=Lentzea sp. NPDC005914 TaxID=3154572 RepID=UPI0033C3806E